jgi:polyribonucleotide nucleotidyltransferase
MIKHNTIVKEAEINGKKYKLETGKLAPQADASVVASVGETVVLATVVSKKLKEDPGYFPLSVEYVEKHYAGGRITPQKFIKREGRPSEKSILSGRAIDRSIRPLFPRDYRAEVQVIITVLSIDQINDPAMVGFIGASAALAMSSVPWNGPIGVVRVGESAGQLIVNADMEDRALLNLDLCWNRKRICRESTHNCLN